MSHNYESTYPHKLVGCWACKVNTVYHTHTNLVPIATPILIVWIYNSNSEDLEVGICSKIYRRKSMHCISPCFNNVNFLTIKICSTLLRRSFSQRTAEVSVAKWIVLFRLITHMLTILWIYWMGQMLLHSPGCWRLNRGNLWR